jgi:hypothetical protein
LLSWPELLEIHLARPPLLSYSPGVVKHSAAEATDSPRETIKLVGLRKKEQPDWVPAIFCKILKIKG